MTTLDTLGGIVFFCVVLLLWLAVPVNIICAVVLAWYGEGFASLGCLASAALCASSGAFLLKRWHR
jgi:hypothetical protein